MYLIMFLFFPILRRLSFIFFKSADTMAMLYASMARPFSTPSLN